MARPGARSRSRSKNPLRTAATPREIRSYMAAIRRAHGPHAYVVLLGLKTYDTLALHEEVKKGLPFLAFEKLMLLMALPQETAARILSIPPRTLHRRKMTGRLDPDESNRVVRLGRLFGRALELFEGDESAARQWLESPALALAGETPLNLSRTEPGSLEVDRLIGRLEHGVIG